MELPVEIMSPREKLFTLIRENAYKFSEEPFTLASGKKSRHYFNCKTITLHPERLSLLAKFLVETHIPSFMETPQAVGGLTMGSDPICYAISLAYSGENKTVFPVIVRKEAKGHGTGKQIEGITDSIRKCLIVDDVITTGGSTLKAVRVLREAGIEITDGICLIDREEGGEAELKKEGIILHPVFKKSEFGKLE